MFYHALLYLDTEFTRVRAPAPEAVLSYYPLFLYLISIGHRSVIALGLTRTALLTLTDYCSHGYAGVGGGIWGQVYTYHDRRGGPTEKQIQTVSSLHFLLQFLWTYRQYAFHLPFCL